MKKKRLGVALVLLLLLLSMPSISIAKSNENEIKNQSNDIYLPEKSKELESLFDEDVYEPSNESQKIPYQEVPKIQENNIKNEQVDKKEKPSKLVKGGNTKAINPLATKENKARGTVIENVDKNGQDITPKVEDQTSRDEKKENPFQMTYSDGNYKYIVVGYGRQQSGGYSVQVKEVYDTENTICVRTALVGPEEADAAKEQPSYPYIVIKIQNMDKTVVFPEN